MKISLTSHNIFSRMGAGSVEKMSQIRMDLGRSNRAIGLILYTHTQLNSAEPFLRASASNPPFSDGGLNCHPEAKSEGFFRDSSHTFRMTRKLLT